VLNVAERAPFPEGVNVTLMVQLAPGESVVPQVVVSAKSLEFAPMMKIGESRRICE
jgi:hypothetical protein